MEEKVIIFIIAFFLIALIVYKKKSKKDSVKKKLSTPTKNPIGRTLNEHILDIINKDNNEH